MSDFLLNEKEIIYILDNEQPTTCPQCGRRTNFSQFLERNEIIQKHYCMERVACGYSFIGEFEHSMVIM
ncbi:MAG: hypothetical protein JWO09_3574 [Bacteroidetes bacterium]|nr:hypothetical protein [Bacteroidota bacterium]